MSEPAFFSPGLLLVLSAYALATASPGPSTLAIMAIAMNRGRRTALVFAAGVISGSMFWGLLAALGLSAVLMRYAHALLVLKLIGGAYLLWLAWKAGRSAWRKQPAANVSDGMGDGWRLYSRGLALHLTNPKAILSWLAIVSLALPPDASALHALSVIGSCFWIALGVFGGYAVAFSTRSAQRAYAAARRWLEGALAVVFGVAGIKLLLTRTSV